MNSRELEYIREKHCREKLPLISFWYNEKVITYCLYWHPSKKFMSRKWNADEGFCLEILSWGLKNKLAPSMINIWLIAEFIFWAWHNLPIKVLKQKNTSEKLMTNAETYLKPRQIFKIELFGLTIFAKKFHHRFSTGFQIRLRNGRRYLKVK